MTISAAADGNDASQTSPFRSRRQRRRRMTQPAIGESRQFPKHRDLGSELSELLTCEALQAMDSIELEYHYFRATKFITNFKWVKAYKFRCITENLRRDNQDKKVREEWKYVAMVIDRLLLYVFFAVTAGGTVGILFSAPNVFEYVNQTAVIEQLKKTAESEINN